MNVSNDKILRYVAGICFIVDAALTIILQTGFSGWLIVGIGSRLLVAISLFTSMPVFLTIGSAVFLISCSYNLAHNLMHFSLYYYDWGYIVVIISLSLNFAVWMLLLIAGINRKFYRRLCISSGILSLFRIAITLVLDIIQLLTGFGNSGMAINFIYVVVETIGILLMGLSVPKKITGNNNS